MIMSFWYGLFIPDRFFNVDYVVGEILWILLKMHHHHTSSLKKFLQSVGNVAKLKCVLNILYVAQGLTFILALLAGCL